MKAKTMLAAACGIAIAGTALAADKPEMGRMAEPMTRSAVEAMVKVHFAQADTNGDGFITKAEADAAREKMETDMRDQHFKALDANGDGSISRAEFDAHHDMHAMKEARPGGEPHGPEMGGHMMMHEGGRGMGMAMISDHMFESADTNKDGRVSLAEALAKPMARFDMADANKDGTITPEERKAAHEKMRAMRH